MSEISAPKRQFLPQNLKISSWEDISPYFKALLNQSIDTKLELEKWLKDRSELEAILEEDMAWRYIKMTIDTANQEYEKRFQHFVTEIEPKISPEQNKLNKKLLASTVLNEIEIPGFDIYLRGVKQQVALFRDENVPLIAELQSKQQKFGSISAKMSVNIDGKELTLQQASALLKDTNREKRRQVYELIQEERAKVKNQLDELYSELIQLRHKVATNAGFDNYRDYKFAEMGRFDYTPEDCFNFHESVRKHIVPLLDQIHKKRKRNLALDGYKPFDTQVDEKGRAPLKPFSNASELIEKTVKCFHSVKPFYAECIATMNKIGHLDLESKKGKAPGGYNYPLYEIGVPFIFMNAVGTLRDLVTMVHEGGHAIHSFQSRSLTLTSSKSVPSEVAELASMSMELISMENWQVFFENQDEYERARTEHLEDVIAALPWIALIDKFQHWIYENPNHSIEEREETWITYFSQFSSSEIDWSGFEEAKKIAWQKQLHLFEVPFYYIEYGMAQLGAIAMWKNYKENKEKTLKEYDAFQQLGYTKTIPEVYKAAGISFDFSPEYIKDLSDFVATEIA